MFGLGTPELIVILGIAFLVFGGKRLPELGSSLGKALSSFKKGIGDVKENGKELISDLPGVKEAGHLQEQVDKVKDIGKVFK
jgi:sec-independent protein translocase protein TatA